MLSRVLANRIAARRRPDSVAEESPALRDLQMLETVEACLPEDGTRGSRLLTETLGRLREEAPESKPEIDYAFEALVTVDTNSWTQFNLDNKKQGGELLVELFVRSGLNLLHSSIRRIDQDSMMFANYWGLGKSADALVNAETKLSDFVPWATFDRSVQRNEDKELITPLFEIPLSPEQKALVDEGAAYLRIVYDVRTADLEEFQARLEAYAEGFGKKRGWLLGTTYLYITGREGRVVQLWLLPKHLVPDARNEQTMWNEIAQMPWLESIEKQGLLEPRSVEDRSQARVNPQWSLNPITSLDPLISQKGQTSPNQ